MNQKNVLKAYFFVFVLPKCPDFTRKKKEMDEMENVQKWSSCCKDELKDYVETYKTWKI